MASCSKMPGQPEPSTTGMLPAGDGTADMLTAAVRTASAAISSGRLPCRQQRVVAAAAAARIALLAPAVLLHDDRHVEAHERPHVGRERAVRRLHEHDLVDAGEAGDDLRDTVVHGADAAVEIGEQRDLVAVAHAAQRIAARDTAADSSQREPAIFCEPAPCVRAMPRAATTASVNAASSS